MFTYESDFVYLGINPLSILMLLPTPHNTCRYGPNELRDKFLNTVLHNLEFLHVQESSANLRSGG